MTRRHMLPSAVTVFALCSLPLPAATDKGVPLGHADFYPTRERPVGWRGNINGLFPGATPVTDWDTGVEPLRDGPAPSTPRSTKNILWKVPMPNWGSSGCIVTGNPDLNGGRRIVVTRASPSTVLAYDADTGARLWYNASDIFDYHFPNDPAKAKELRALWSRIERQDGLGLGTQGKSRPKSWTKEEKEDWERITDELLTEHPEYFGRGARAAFDAEMKRRATKAKEADREKSGDLDLAVEKIERTLDKTKEDEDEETPKVSGSVYGIRCRVGVEPFFSMGVAPNKYINCYEAGVSTPVSDGRYVWTADAYNLVACYDLKDGSIRWRKWTGPLRSMHAVGGISYFYNEYWPSPWLFAGKLFVFNNWYLHAFDPDSGQSLYSVDIGPTARSVTNGVSWPGETNKYDNMVYGWGHDHGVNCAFLTVGETPVVVIPCGWAVRASDGKVLSRDIGTAMMASGAAAFLWDDERDLVVSKHHFGAGAPGEPGGPSGFRVTRLSIEADGALKSDEYFFDPIDAKQRYWNSNGPVQFGDIVHFGKKAMLDIAKRRWVSADMHTAGRQMGGGRYQSLAAPGNSVWRFGDFLDYGTLAYGRGSVMELFPDGTVRRTFAIPPLAEPVEPLLDGGSTVPTTRFPTLVEEPPDAPVRRWAREAVKEGVISWLNPPPVDFCWLNDSYSAQPFFHGDRIYHRSRAFLYCVGPALKGGPKDDPKIAQAIRGAKGADELAEYLKSDSAQYRYEAVKRLATLESGNSKPDILKRLAAEDPYEDIRASAILLLNGSDGAAGFEATRPSVEKHGRWWHMFPHERPHRTHMEHSWAPQTFQALGEAGDAWLIATVRNTNGPPELRFGAMAIVGEGRRRADATKRLCMDVAVGRLNYRLHQHKKGMFMRLGVSALASLWPDDPEAVDFLIANVLGGYEMDETLYVDLADVIRPPLAAKFWREAALKCADSQNVTKYMARAIEAVEPSAPFVAEVKAKAIAGDALRCELAVHLAEPERTRFVKDVLRDAADRSKGYMVQALARWNSYKLYDFTPARDEIKPLTKHKNEEISKWANGLMKELDPNWGKVKEDLLTETADPPKPPDL